MLNDKLVPKAIIRVKRRSIALIIDKNGELVVRAPKNAKESEIWAFINEKSNWILKKRAEALRSIEVNTLNLNENEKFNILGENYIMTFQDCKTAKIKGEYLILPNINTKTALISLLKRDLKKYLANRVYEIACKCNLTFKSISITSATTNWGSCGMKNSLNFTYKLALCPKYVIDYIIVHELCHTKVKNHSTKFWNMVKSIYPEYKYCEKWLKTNRAIINMI